MKTILPFFILVLFFLAGNEIQAQQDRHHPYFENAGEMYFSFSVPDEAKIQKLSRCISIDDIKEDQIFAYANREEFDSFLKFDLPYQILPKPGESGEYPKMKSEITRKDIDTWDFYPTYEAYLAMMNQFASDYPSLCQSFSIGQSGEGRELMMLKISANVAVREAEPKFLYTGTIHGDELVGYILLLRLADHLLSNYGIDPDITQTLDNIEIWINPLANPDGTFAGGNSTVWGSTRYNANNVDLNRNYPDAEDGPHPDGKAWQAETMAFMQLAEENDFVMSANIHAGAEVINYPWDTWSRLAADDGWWQFVSREYADTAHLYAPSSYLDGFVNGITNGYAWYSISGGRQDYMNYFRHCREVTMELSNTKKLATNTLENHWQWNYRSLLNYLQQCSYGVAGLVTDGLTGVALAAEVSIEGHDLDNSQVVADSLHGFYQRLLAEGTYDITYTAEGYPPLTIPNVSVSRYSTTRLDVQLSSGTLSAAFTVSQQQIGLYRNVDFSDNSFGTPVQWKWQFQGGNPSSASIPNPVVTYPNIGLFDVQLTVHNQAGDSSTVLMEDFMDVRREYAMSNQSLTVENGIFYDSGGEGQNYGNNEDALITFFPACANSKLRLEFLMFNIEENATCSYDWLRIYDGTSAAAPLLGIWCGTDSPGTVSATNAEGALTVEFHSDNSVNLPGWKALIDCAASQSLELEAGWSGISLYLNPDKPAFDDIFAGLANQLEILIGEQGVYWPANNINTLDFWDDERGYIIKMNESASLNIPGILKPERDLNLAAGWNYFPVLQKEALPVDELADVLAGKIMVITEVAGTRIYWPEMNIYTLTNLQAGKTYYICLNAGASFTFPGLE